MDLHYYDTHNNNKKFNVYKSFYNYEKYRQHTLLVLYAQ
jgi:hypothetical protein